MATFVTPVNGDDALAEHVAQLTENFQGLRNIPISVSGINDAAAYALTVKNAGTGSKDAIMYAADGTTVLLQVDGTGVKASASGGTAAPIMTTGSTVGISQIADASITNAKLAADTARANLLTNGGFEIWQRGNGPFSAAAAYTADLWVINITGGSTLSVSRDSANADGGTGACAALTFSFVAESFFSQRVGDINQLRGRTITFSCRVRTSTANAIRLAIGDQTNNTYGSFHTGNGSYQTLSVTRTISTGATLVQMNIAMGATGTFYVDNAMLVVGSVAADYAPLHPADDLVRCQRYYEVYGGTSFAPFVRGNVPATGNLTFNWLYKASKPVAPSVTKAGTWAVTNCAQPTVLESNNLYSACIGAVVTATGDAFWAPNSADDVLISEANP